MTGLIELPLFGVLAITPILFAAGLTKGVIGVGMPTVAVPLLCIVMPLPSAVAALAIPVLITNLTQAVGPDRVGVVLQTLWPIMAGTVGGMIIGVRLLTSLSPNILKPVVGAALIGVAVSMLVAPKLHCPERLAPIASPIAGIGSGILGGLAGQSAPILSLYLLSRGITGNRFVQYSSIYLVFASIALALTLGNAGAIGWMGATISTACSVPILFGMWVGQRVRAGVPAALSRKLVLCMVALGGISMVHLPLSTVFSAPPPHAASLTYRLGGEIGSGR
jgi:uncharacterized membrane protein YfcA